MASTKIVQTADGSHTLFSVQYNAHYHSLNGAIQESLHVFIKNGFGYFSLKEINVLEVGFGTGLNAALTASMAIKSKCKTKYTGIDIHPPENEILIKLNYEFAINSLDSESWRMIISSKWGKGQPINDYFLLNKIQADFNALKLIDSYNLIYFDAFAPDDQPEMWTIDVFKKLFNATKAGGVLVTYCSKGIVKQALREVGYKVERLAGPPGKRHMVRATRL